jgi:bla regulator protein blaR1
MANLPFFVSGIRGGHLATRIEEIVANRRRSELTRARRAALIVAAITVGLVPMFAGALTMQSQAQQSLLSDRPHFEVASIKRNVSVNQLSSMNGEPGGRMAVTNHTLLNIIRQVYRLQRYQVVGGPDWVDKDHWDILAKAAGDAPFDQLLKMMEPLLADRFKLLTHREAREMPVYALVLTRPDGRLGPQVKPSMVDCEAIAAAAKSGGTPPPAVGGGPRCGININNNQLRMSAKRMTDLARNLSIMTDRFVVDRTGLNGIFDLELQWNEVDGPSLATAMQEQLGLKLDTQRAIVDVLVIDSAQRPAQD